MKHWKYECLHLLSLYHFTILFFTSFLIMETHPAVIVREKYLPVEVFNTDEEATQRVLNLAALERYEQTKEEIKDNDSKFCSSNKQYITKHLIPTTVVTNNESEKISKQELHPEKNEIFSKGENEGVNQQKYVQESYTIDSNKKKTKSSLNRHQDDRFLLNETILFDKNAVLNPESLGEDENQNNLGNDLLTPTTSVQSETISSLLSKKNDAATKNNYPQETEMEPYYNVVHNKEEQGEHDQNIDDPTFEATNISDQIIKGFINQEKENKISPKVEDLQQLKEDQKTETMSKEDNANKINTENLFESDNNLYQIGLADQLKNESNQPKDSLNQSETQNKSVFDSITDSNEDTKPTNTKKIDMINESCSNLNEIYLNPVNKVNMENINTSVLDMTKDLSLEGTEYKPQSKINFQNEVDSDSDGAHEVLLANDIENINALTVPKSAIIIKDENTDDDTSFIQQKIENTNNNEDEHTVTSNLDQPNLIQISLQPNNIIQPISDMPENSIIQERSLDTLNLKNNSMAETENMNNVNNLEMTCLTEILPGINHQIRATREISDKCLSSSDDKDDTLSQILSPISDPTTQEQYLLKAEENPTEILPKMDYLLREPRELKQNSDINQIEREGEMKYNLEKNEDEIGNNAQVNVLNDMSSEQNYPSKQARVTDLDVQENKHNITIQDEEGRKLVDMLHGIYKILEQKQKNNNEKMQQENNQIKHRQQNSCEKMKLHHLANKDYRYPDYLPQITVKDLTEFFPKINDLIQKNPGKCLESMLLNQIVSEPQNEQKLFEYMQIVSNIIKNINQPVDKILPVNEIKPADEILSHQVECNDENGIPIDEISPVQISPDVSHNGLY